MASKKSNDTAGPSEKPKGEEGADYPEVTQGVDPSKGEVNPETGKVMDEKGNEPPDAREVQVAGTALMEPVEPAKDAIVPLPEKPKLAVGQVSTRALNHLPDGGEYPKEPVAPVNIRESIRKGQELRREHNEK